MRKRRKTAAQAQVDTFKKIVSDLAKLEKLLDEPDMQDPRAKEARRKIELGKQALQLVLADLEKVRDDERKATRRGHPPIAGSNVNAPSGQTLSS